PVALKNDPPTIFSSTKPAILLIVEGDPVLSPIEGTNLASVINTNWDLFQETTTKRYYLLYSTGWLTASDLTGPWTTTQTVPRTWPSCRPATTGIQSRRWCLRRHRVARCRRSSTTAVLRS